MNHVGPPPVRPTPPAPERVNHILHLILTLVTAGMWALVWILVAVNARAADQASRREHREAMHRYHLAYQDWQARYFATYGQPPPY